MNKARLAVIGLNFGKLHANNIAKGDMPAQLVAISDMKPDYAALADSLDTNFYEDYRKMLETEHPDGVIIAVPPKFHKAIALDCMDAGAHVLVEKPVTLFEEEADELAAREAASGKRILVGQHHRFDPSVLMAKERLASGGLGRPIGFHIFGMLPKPAWYFKDDYRRMRDSGGGTVSNNGIHDVDRIRYLCGEIESVCAMKGNAARGFEVEDTAAVSIRMKSGMVGTYYISDSSHTASEFTDFYFATEGTIRFKCSSFYAQPGFHVYEETVLGEGFAYDQRSRKVDAKYLPLQNNHAKEAEHFCDVILNGAQPRTTVLDGKRSLQALNAIIQSLDSGNMIKLD